MKDDAGCGLVMLALIGGLVWVVAFFTNISVLYNRVETQSVLLGSTYYTAECHYLNAVGLEKQTKTFSYGPYGRDQFYCPRLKKGGEPI